MKKYCALAGAALLAVLMLTSAAFAGGRLNFMLINMTDVDIVEARICPTSYPQYLSENLLNTNLEPNTRLYIGPNYYGEQKYWNIQLTWSNGYTHTFTHSQLTRYNTYMAYSSPTGVRLRQSYERQFARYNNFGPNESMYGGGMPGYAVAVGVPEKVNVAQPAASQSNFQASNSGRAAANMVADSTRRTRDLVFEDDEEEEAAPVISGSTAENVGGETIAMKATVEMTRDGETITVLPTEEFKSGDKVRLIFSTNRDGHIYWLSKGTSGEYQVLFPTAQAGMDNKVVRNQEYTVPTKGAWRFDDNKGTETVVCILAPEPIADLDKAVQLADAGNKEEASRLVASIVDAHETNRTTRDLVFEEEDENDVNTKMQRSEGDEPFVATYELTHN